MCRVIIANKQPLSLRVFSAGDANRKEIEIYYSYEVWVIASQYTRAGACLWVDRYWLHWRAYA
jgi:hypothetical protein